MPKVKVRVWRADEAEPATEDGFVSFPINLFSILAVFGIALAAVFLGLPEPAAFTFEWRFVGWGLALAVAIQATLQLIGWLIPQAALDAAHEEQAHIKERTWLGAIATSVWAGVFEEILFRGLAQAGLALLIGHAGAIALVNVLFGLGHSRTNLLVILITGGVGAALGVTFAVTGSLIVVIVAHAAINMMSFAAERAGLREWTKQARSRGANV